MFFPDGGKPSRSYKGVRMGTLAQLPKDMLLDQLQNGLVLLLLGMGTVFVFLIILVFVIKAMSAIIRKVSPAKASAPVARPVAVTAAPAVSASADAEIAAAIVAAVAQSKK